LRVVPSFRSFASRVNPRYVWYHHCEVMADALECVAAGEIKRLMIFAPPRSGKSELVSRLFPAYYLDRFPERFAAIASYASELAFDLSRAARRNFTGGQAGLAGESKSVKQWETGKGGGLWATGVGGPATGKGFHLGISDDPLKNAQEASSRLIRDRQREWWRSVWYTRCEPNAAIVLVMTRWHLDDLAGWLLAEEAGEDPERWTVLCLPSIADSEPRAFPSTCTVLPDWRKAGEPLVPERYPLAKLEQIRSRIGNYYWEALHQQRPRPKAGGMYKWDAFRSVDALPEGARWLAYWDTAGTEGAGDNTAGVLMGRTREGRYVVADCVAGQWSPGRKDSEVKAACERWRALVALRTVWLERESGVGGEERSKSTVRALAGFDVRTERPTGSKEDRGMPFAAQAEAGNVDVLRGPWNHAFLEELADFPHSAHDDRHDAAAGAFNRLAADLDGHGGGLIDAAGLFS
jgi:predicted phage terminase large subunit-like protein